MGGLGVILLEDGAVGGAGEGIEEAPLLPPYPPPTLDLGIVELGFNCELLREEEVLSAASLGVGVRGELALVGGRGAGMEVLGATLSLAPPIMEVLPTEPEPIAPPLDDDVDGIG